MKKITMAIAMLLMAGAAFAATKYTHTLVVETKSGETTEFLFTDTPVATFENTNMVITAKQGAVFYVDFLTFHVV